MKRQKLQGAAQAQAKLLRAPGLLGWVTPLAGELGGRPTRTRPA